MTSYYSSNVDSLFQQYEGLDPEQVHASWAQHLPSTKSQILDVGAGSGRDARWLAGKGHEVVSVEPAAGMLEKAQSIGGSASIQWINDTLPALSETYRLDLKFDLILLSAVWMHVKPADRERAFRKLVNLLKPGGKLIISLRHGPAGDGREFHPVSSQELNQLANGHVLEVVQESVSDDQLGRKDVSWEVIVFRLPDDGTGALPLLRHVIINDAKSSTYKLALLRVLLRIADGAQGAVLCRDADYVTLPFGLVALYWVKAFKPLVLDAGYLQQPSSTAGLGFVKEGFNALKDVSPYDLRVGASFEGQDARNLFMAIRDSRNTIKKMPALYTTYPNSDEPVFPCEKATDSMIPSFRLDSEFLSSFGTFKVPVALWNAMSQYACWIEPAVVSEWCSLMQGYDLRAERKHPLEDYLRHLAWFDAERNTSEVRSIIDGMRSRGKSIHCVWSGKALRHDFDVDHCLPFAHWPNNDLWNLMPAHPKVNNSKSGKLPSAEALEKAEERILNWWGEAYSGDVISERFLVEAKSSLPVCGIGRTEIDSEMILRGVHNQRVRLKVNQQLQEWFLV